MKLAALLEITGSKVKISIHKLNDKPGDSFRDFENKNSVPEELKLRTVKNMWVFEDELQVLV